MKSDLLIEARIKRGWTQAKVAEAVGVDVRTVSRWERGKAVPYPYYRERLCSLFDKTARQLGLFSVDEDELLDDTSSCGTQSTASDTSESFLADTGVLLSPECADSSVGHESLLMQAEEPLLAGGYVTQEQFKAEVDNVDEVPLSLPKKTNSSVLIKKVLKDKKSKLLLSVFVCVIVVVSGTFTTFLALRANKPALSLGLVGYWPLNEGTGTNTRDASGNGNLAQINGATWTEGYLGNALSFNGLSDTVDVNRPVVDTSTSFSVAAWVQLSDLSGWRTAVSQDGNYVSGFFLQLTNTGQFAFSLVTPDSPTAVTIRATSNFTVAAHTWYHLVGVYNANASESNLYVNGTLRSTQMVPPTFQANGETVIGRAQWDKATDFWSGQIEDVRLYNRALSSADVEVLYNSFHK